LIWAPILHPHAILSIGSFVTLAAYSPLCFLDAPAHTVCAQVARLSTDLVFTGLSLANSALWTFTLSESSSIVVDSVHVSGSRQYPNNDGLDCISCSHLTVSNSAFSTGGRGTTHESTTHSLLSAWWWRVLGISFL
jgi:hypothetical protein